MTETDKSVLGYFKYLGSLGLVATVVMFFVYRNGVGPGIFFTLACAGAFLNGASALEELRLHGMGLTI